jgi:hypothetical protein
MRFSVLLEAAEDRYFVTTLRYKITNFRAPPTKANPNSRCHSRDFLILILDEIQVISW